MSKKIRWLFVVISLPLLLGATNKTKFTITGVSSEKLLTNIELRLDELGQTKPLVQQTDEQIRLQVEQAMQPYGYFKPQISISRQPLRIAIIPGPQMIITRLVIQVNGEGAKNRAIQKSLKQLPLAQGQPFNSATYEEAKQNLLDTAEHHGYLQASFKKSEIALDIKTYTAQISLLLETGPQYYFGQVQFDPSYISPELLYRYIPFHYGQPYSSDKILTFNNQLVSSGYFRRIAIKPQTDGTARYIPINVHLQQVARLSYSFGAGYGTDTGIRGRAGFHVVPVNRAGDKFNLVALGSYRQSALQAQYVVPGHNPLVDQYNLNTNLSAMNYGVGHSNAALVSLAQQHQLARFQRILSLNALYENYRYTNRPREEKTTLFPKLGLTWLDTKNTLFSPSGYNIGLTGLGATKAFLSQENFAQASLNAKAALTVNKWRTRFYFHIIQGVTSINRIDQLPLSLALLLGGAENLKAYSYNSIGPGKIINYAGFEIQKETVDHWYFVGFFDSGDVYMPSTKHFNYDVGLALMWVSPVGPIKIGVAQAVDNHFSRQRSPRFVVNLGPDL